VVVVVVVVVVGWTMAAAACVVAARAFVVAWLKPEFFGLFFNKNVSFRGNRLIIKPHIFLGVFPASLILGQGQLLGFKMDSKNGDQNNGDTFLLSHFGPHFWWYT
jgi:hypothetical protein